MKKTLGLIIFLVVFGIITSKVSYMFFFYQWTEAEIEVRSSENKVYDKIISHMESKETEEAMELIYALKQANIDLIIHLSGKNESQ